MPRVLFVHHRPQPSGAARSLALLIEGLGDEWETHVLVPDGGAARLFERVGARVHRGPVPAFTHTWDVQYQGLRWLVAAREAAWLPSHRRQLLRILSDSQPDVVHLNDVVQVASGRFASRAGFPVVWHLRSSLPDEGRDRRSRLLTAFIERTSAATIAIDVDVAATFDLNPPPVVIPNPVTCATTRTDAAATPACPDRVSIGLLGYLRGQKGWPQFLEALRILLDRELPVHGVVIGGGVRGSGSFRGLRGRLLELCGVPDEEGSFAQRVTSLGLERHVTHHPFTDTPENALAAIDVLVFPNQGRGLGRPVLEAAACGKPVVASGSPSGAGLLLDGETGYLTRPDAASIADALSRLVLDPALRARLGAEGARHAAQFEPRVIGLRVEDVWRGVLAGRASSREGREPAGVPRDARLDER
jgi:glycosyltransferase involved in cell wall biosynthesis